MTQEALKLALDALENNKLTHLYCEDTWYSCPKHEDGCANEFESDECNCGAEKVNAEFDKAITAIKEALAQTQEPVAMWDGKYQIEFGNLSAYKHGEHSWIPLYTTPPQEQQSCDKRTWVGLTNNELQPIADEYRILFGGWVEDFARAIEARLKEKNETL